MTGAFRVLCDGDHDSEIEGSEEEIVDAVASEEIGEPVFVTPPRVEPPL